METLTQDRIKEKVPASNDVANNSVISTIIFGILTALAFLLPIFFIPVLPIPLIFAKHGLLALLVSIGIILWSIEAIKVGSFSFSKSPLLITLGALVLISIASSLMSESFRASFFGLGGEMDTTLALIFFSAFAFLAAEYANNMRRIMSIVLAVLASFLLLALYEIARFFLPTDVLSFGVFFSPITTPMGGWYNLAAFSGLISILLVASLDTLSQSKVFSAIAVVLLVISLAFIAIINFAMIWVLLALFSIAVLAYETSNRLRNGRTNSTNEVRQQKRISIPQTSLVVFIVSVFFFFAGGVLSSFVTDYFNLNYIETRPSWSSTLEIEKASLNENPILGVGPNRFKQAWDEHRPEGVNETQFWNADYNAGFGFIPTFAVTHGLLGILIWLAMGVSLIFVSAKVLFKNGSVLNRFISTIVILSGVYLWLVSFFYVPSYALIALMFLFIGLALALLAMSEPLSRKNFVFVEKVNVAFVTIFLLALVLLGGIWVGYSGLRQSVAIYLFRTGLVSAGTSGDFNEGIARTSRALNLYESDLYYRSLAEMTVRNLDANLASASSQEQLQAALESVLSQSVGLARGAINYDSGNVDNWLSLASVYEYMLTFGVEGSYDAAQATYLEAQKRDPITPSIDLALARVALAVEDEDSAEEHIDRALEKKPNYTDALVMLSQMSLGEGDTEGALRTMTLAALSSPQNSDIYLNMGLILYQQERFEEAIPILERAVLINPYYANAKYFLALSYYEVGRRQDAILQFRDVATLNPDNTTVTEILENLEAGLSPLSGVENIESEE